jgi:hypothetical protein
VDAILVPRRTARSLVAGAALLVAVGAAVALVARPADPLGPAPPTADSKPGARSAEPARPSTGPTTALRGQVTDTAGRPVPGATVAALVRRAWAPGDRGLRDDPVARATTGADGWYALDVPSDFATHYPERAVTLLVSGPGHPPTTKLVRLESGGADVGIPAARSVGGVLVDPDGKPAAGVRLGVVRLGSAAAEPVQGQERKPPEGWPAEVVSGPDGTFAFAGLPAGEGVWVEVRDQRFALSSVRIAANESAPVHITLEPPRVLNGLVTGADTGKPLAGAKVSVFAGPWESHHDRYTAMTVAPDAPCPPSEFDTLSGPDGRFRLNLPPSDPYRVFVHPPDAAAYLSIGRTVNWDPDRTGSELAVALPPGEVLRGVLRDDTGKPLAGGWVSYDVPPENRSAPPDVLRSRDVPVRTGADGSFRLIVPSGTGKVCAFGPTANYLPVSHDLLRCSWCGNNHVRRFEHALTRVEVPVGRTPDPLALVLKVGVVSSGKALGPDGAPVRHGVLVSRSVVQPLRGLVPRPLLIRDGSFELPGCSPDRVYPVVLLDAERLCGAVAELKGGGAVPVVKLEPCGTAQVRLRDLLGRPRPGVPAALALALDYDRTAAWGPKEQGAGPVEQSWFDPRNHLPAPVTGANGWVTLRALVPGANYTVRFAVGAEVYESVSFRVEPAQTVRLPDVVIGPLRPVAPLPGRGFHDE